MTQKNILVVEDDDSIRRLLMEYLRDTAAVEVDGARDGVDALHQISTRPYSVVVLDMIMPYMSGVAFLSSLEARMSDPSIPSLDELPAILVITSVPPEEISTENLQQRFPQFVRGVLRKPLDLSTLARRVESLLA